VFIVGLSHFLGFNEWALRLPSALAAGLTIFSVYRIGRTLENAKTGLIAAWLLLTTFYFIFWARVASADMLNVAGIFFALSVYLEAQLQARFKDYLLFFVTVALACLCKGLIAAVCTLLLIVPFLYQTGLKGHIHLKSIAALLLAMIIYLLPFVGSYFWSGQTHQSGLYLVFRENVLRYFQAFDHVGHWYTYFIYLPLYTLPWTPLCLLGVMQGLKTKEFHYRALVWSLVFLFLFFSLSGSRRSYYVLPMVPLASLIGAFYLARMQRLLPCVEKSIAVFALIFFLCFGVILSWPASNLSLPNFGKTVREQASLIKPWSQWRVISVKALPRTLFYIHSENPIESMTPAQFEQMSLPEFNREKSKIIITRFSNYQALALKYKHYRVIIESEPSRVFLKPSEKSLANRGVALIPCDASCQTS
jgi:4-amino-4-deoxy-L-arabinose transferase-like glycosyltransferase